jgi:hypothetical protein
LSLAFAALLALAAADGPPRIRASELEKPTLALAERLLGQPDPKLVEVNVIWLPGVAQYSGVAAYFAQRPVPGGGAGLCRVEMRWARLKFVEPRAQDAELDVAETGQAHGYALTSAAPGLKPVHPDGQESPCAHLTPVLQDRHWRVTRVQAGDREANDAEAGFGFMTLLAARTATKPDLGRCDDPGGAACQNPRGFLRQLDPRDVQALELGPCRGDAKHLCVTAFIKDEKRDGGSIITIETGAAALPARLSAPARIRRVSVGTYRDPVF